ncbi:glutathione transferase GstA [uncultured Roseobacter sp.]|uniref:glutathione transferase GstA n=1 Tax=uncultured Roseobacter sp. TaxID=114847 RepID=UPI002602CBFC|nr:glutathione transferase GstA [uncultured Roseobacter sp.]
MNLYYAPFACSLASHITCLEGDIPISLNRVDLGTKALSGGEMFWDVNPKGQVPTLKLDDGSVLTEGTAVLQYLADLRPDSGLAPSAGTMERYRLMEWLNFVATELHKRILYMAFDPDSDAATKARAREAASSKLDLLEDHLGQTHFLLGDTFTVADAYLYWWLFLAPRAGVEIGDRPAIRKYVKICEERPTVQAAVAAEAKAQKEP